MAQQVQRRSRALVALVGLVLLPVVARAQAPSSIAGVVTDATGGVLPGVSVEASSPALIEKLRNVVTDSQGQYRIVDLRPGTYTVTFTLQGFGTVVREGIELSSGFTATINGELKVGSLEETITVSGQSPLVDVQNTRVQQVLTSEVIEVIPSSRGFSTFVALTPGVTINPSFQDVGGVQHDNAAAGSIWGSRPGEFKIQLDGMHAGNILGSGGGRSRGIMLNMAIAEESNINLGGATAEDEVGGVFINLIPKEGGNTFSGFLFGNYTNNSLQSDNLSDELRGRGLTRVNEMDRIWDFNATLGGPLRKDKVWFFATARNWGRDRRVGDNYWNKTQGTPFYTRDLGRPATKDVKNLDYTARLTWQAAEKHKFNFHYTYEDINFLEQIDFAPTAPEAAPRYRFFPDNLAHATWRSPVTNRILLEAGFQSVVHHYPISRQPGVNPSDISITELSTSYRYNAFDAYGPSDVSHIATRFAASYVTGSHAFKVGISTMSGYFDRTRITHGDVTYQFLNQVPVQVTQWATPLRIEDRLRMNMGIYVQDQWTMKRLTLNLGVRYDYLNGEVPAQHRPAIQFLPARSLEPVKNVPNWKDVSPRLGVAYDLFGNGKTAIKGSIGRYVVGQAIGFVAQNNPMNTVVNNVTRTWNDVNGNYIPDCDLPSPVANGECGAFSHALFGQPRVTTRFAKEVTEGFAQRPYNWLAMTEVQHELFANVSAHAGYVRRWYGNFTITDNLAVGPQDFSPYSIAAPNDPRLPGGGGFAVTGLYDVNPSKFGQVNNLVTLASKFGDQSEVSDFINLTVSARFGNGAMLSGGLDTGRTVTDRCFVVDSPGELRFCRVVTPFAAQTQVKFNGSYPLPWDFRVSGNYQNLSDIPIQATRVATNAEIAPSLGRNLALGARGTALVDLIQPNTLLEDRIHQVDFRLVKIVRLQRTRLELQFDVYNALNASPVLSMNTRYGPQWLRPIQILDGRIIKFGAQLTF